MFGSEYRIRCKQGLASQPVNSGAETPSGPLNEWSSTSITQSLEIGTLKSLTTCGPRPARYLTAGGFEGGGGILARCAAVGLVERLAQGDGHPGFGVTPIRQPTQEAVGHIQDISSDAA